MDAGPYVSRGVRGRARGRSQHAGEGLWGVRCILPTCCMKRLLELRPPGRLQLTPQVDGGQQMPDSPSVATPREGEGVTCVSIRHQFRVAKTWCFNSCVGFILREHLAEFECKRGYF